MYILLIFHVQYILETKFINTFIFFKWTLKTYWWYSHIQETICKINFDENNWKVFKLQYLVYNTYMAVLIENAYFQCVNKLGQGNDSLWHVPSTDLFKLDIIPQWLPSYALSVRQLLPALEGDTGEY